MTQDTIFGSSSNKVWVVSWNAIDTDSITGTQSVSEIEQMAGAKPKQSFSLSMTSGDEYATYSFITGGGLKDSVYDLDFIKIEYLDIDSQKKAEQWVANNCFLDLNRDGYKDSYGADKLFYSVRYCYKVNKQYGTPRLIGSPREIFNTNWKLQIEGKSPEPFTVSNEKNVAKDATTRLGNTALIKWQGTLKTGARAPEPSNVMGMHSNSLPQGWKIVNKENYNRWSRYIDGEARSCLSEWSSGRNTETSCENSGKNIASGVLLDTDEQQFKQGTITGTTLSAGQFKLDLAERVGIPTFQVYINADELKVDIPVGEAEIVSVSSLKFDEGGIGTISTRVRNAGSSTGSFDVGIIGCTANFKAASLIQDITLGAKEETVVTLQITGSSESSTIKEISGTCTVFMKERTTQVQRTNTVTVSFVQEGECVAGKERETIRDGRYVIQVCNSNGLTWSDVKVCGENQVTEPDISGKLQCVDKKSDTQNDFFGGIGRWIADVMGAVWNAAVSLFWFIVIGLIIAAVIIVFLAVKVATRNGDKNA